IPLGEVEIKQGLQVIECAVIVNAIVAIDGVAESDAAVPEGGIEFVRGGAKSENGNRSFGRKFICCRGGRQKRKKDPQSRKKLDKRFHKNDFSFLAPHESHPSHPCEAKLFTMRRPMKKAANTASDIMMRSCIKAKLGKVFG